MIIVKSTREIELMRVACKVIAKVFNDIKPYIKPGISTLEISNIAEKIINNKVINSIKEIINNIAIKYEINFDAANKIFDNFESEVISAIDDKNFNIKDIAIILITGDKIV